MVIDVQAPSPASRNRTDPGPLSLPPAATGSSAIIRCGPTVTVCWNLLARVSCTTTVRGAFAGIGGCSGMTGSR